MTKASDALTAKHDEWINYLKDVPISIMEYISVQINTTYSTLLKPGKAIWLDGCKWTCLADETWVNTDGRKVSWYDFLHKLLEYKTKRVRPYIIHED